MDDDLPTAKRSPTGPGCLMLIAIIGGTVTGMRNHQPSAGLVIGMAVAVAVAGLIWLWDRLR